MAKQSVAARAGRNVVEELTSRLQRPWSGVIDAKSMKRPGGLLMSALARCAHERGQSLPELAEQLGYSYPYINLLISGARRVDQVSDDFIGACSAYLGLPKAAVLMMSGKLEAKDFFGPGDFHAELLDAAMRYIESDTAWSPLVTAELRQASPSSKFCLIKLYEAAAGKRLLADQFDPQGFGRELDRVHAEAARMRCGEMCAG
jgi:transcriptional regulator with XRE-family HTH domain